MARASTTKEDQKSPGLASTTLATISITKIIHKLECETQPLERPFPQQIQQINIGLLLIHSQVSMVA